MKSIVRVAICSIIPAVLFIAVVFSPGSLSAQSCIPPGDPSVFGDDVWNVYDYTYGNTIDYRGFLTAASLDFRSTDYWPATGNPTNSPLFQGCSYGSGDLWYARRRGFPCGFYSISIQGSSPSGLLINGKYVWASDVGTRNNVWQGVLGPDDSVDLHLATGSNFSSSLMSFAPITSVGVTGPDALCEGLSAKLSAPQFYGAVYSWSNGATTPSIIVNEAVTYTVNITPAKGCGTIISGSKTVIKNPTPVLTITGNTSICTGSSTTLTASGAQNYLWTGAGYAYPDSIQGLKLALGLRKLVKTYNGPALTLVRYSTGTEMDFGFLGNELDTAAISAWLNGEVGYCTHLYDQSGNGGDVFVYNNYPSLTLNGPQGKPTLHYNSNDGSSLNNDVKYRAPFTVIYGAQQTGGARQRVLTAVNNNWLLGYWNGGKQQAYFEGWVSTTPGQPLADDNYYVYSGTSDGTTANVYENGIPVLTGTNGVAGPDGIALNDGVDGEFSDADIYDVLIYDHVLSTDERQYAEGSMTGDFISGNPRTTVSPLSSTQYVVRGYNSTGCYASQTVNVTVQPLSTFYRDADNDGYGNPNVSTQACSAPAGYVNNNTDCDDTHASVHPGATEICDGLDNNCNGQIDEGVKTTFYRDADNDGYGNPNVSTQACSAPVGYVNNNTDCDDTHASVYPGAPEICDGLDNNCNGTIDEGCITLSIADVSINEGNKGKTNMMFIVALSKASTKKVTVQFATQNGTAIAGSDYDTKSGTLTFTPGNTKQTINVSIIGDKITESNETFKVNLTNAVNATIAKATGVGTILNDDGTVSFVYSNNALNISNDRSIKIAPNPATNILHIELFDYTGNVEMKLMSLQGKIIRQEQIQTTSKYAQQQMNVADIASGVYLLVIVDEKGDRKIEKVIIAR